MESIYYKDKRVAGYHAYISEKQFYQNKNLGFIQFEGLEAFIDILTASDEDMISCAGFGKVTIKDFKRKLQEENLAIYLSFDSHYYHEGIRGIKQRIDH